MPFEMLLRSQNDCQIILYGIHKALVDSDTINANTDTDERPTH